VHAVLDRPSECGGEHESLAGQTLTEDAQAVQPALRGNAPDDACARRTVPEQVGMRREVDGDLVVALGIEPEGGGGVDAADEWMVRVDSAVDDRDVDAGAGCSAPRPVAGDRGREGARNRRQQCGVELFAPRRSQARRRSRPLV
jgi:hypothetical protein